MRLSYMNMDKDSQEWVGEGGFSQERSEMNENPTTTDDTNRAKTRVRIHRRENDLSIERPATDWFLGDFAMHR